MASLGYRRARSFQILSICKGYLYLLFYFRKWRKKNELKIRFCALSILLPKRFGVKVRPQASGGELQESGLKHS